MEHEKNIRHTSWLASAAAADDDLVYTLTPVAEKMKNIGEVILGCQVLMHCSIGNMNSHHKEFSEMISNTIGIL